MGTRKIKIWKDPYDLGFNTCTKSNIELHDGLTVLVGCNGSGKTTMIHNIETELKKKKIPLLMYNNLYEGGTQSVAKQLFYGDITSGAELMTSSEGEAISYNIGNVFKRTFEFLKTGKASKSSFDDKLSDIIFKDKVDQEELSNERWILFDAIDSGMSIDNVIEFKEVLPLLFEDAEKFGVDLYIIAVANEYELANGEDCFDVISGKYIKFTDYEDYKKFILNSRKKKNKRFE